MWSYFIRRILQACFTLFIVTGVCFILTLKATDPMADYATDPHMTSADRLALEHELGLDQPLPIRYVKWLGLAVQGNLGMSSFSHQPVLQMIEQRLPMTLILMVTAEVCIIIFALILGLVAAVRQYSLTDNLITSFSFIGYSMPIFFIAFGAMQIFAVQFKLWGLPYLPTGADVWDFSNPVQLAWHLVLPVFQPRRDSDSRLFTLPAFQHSGGAGHGLRSHRACQGLKQPHRAHQTCPTECNPSFCNCHRP